jgi:autotransporter-associated beta strand protein
LASPIQIEAGTLKIGHASALGATGATGVTKLMGGTLDLNGQSIGETLNVSVNSSLNNSSSSAASISADATLTANLGVNTAGDVTVARLIGSGGTRTITKDGLGTLKTTGNDHNNLIAWVINSGTVELANTSGYGADRGVTISGGTLKLSGGNSDLINNSDAVIVNTGTFNLNGKNEAVALSGAGGIVTNGQASTTSTLYIGGGTAGSYTGSYAGVIQNGAGLIKLTKEGTGTQTLTGPNTYTGDTTISKGTLSITNTYLADASSVYLVTGGVFDLNYAGADAVSALYFDGVAQVPGTWGATGSGAAHVNDTFFTGTGVLSVVPEPASLSLMLMGGLTLLRRKQR